MKAKTELPPLENTQPEVSPAPDSAGGLPAVALSMQFAVTEMGLVRGIRELSKVNQMGGFDCPGCAWPDPDDKRELTEFCENGAKAVAEEATLERVNPAFFAKHSVAEIGSWSDYKIGKSGRVTHPMHLKKGGTHYEPISWENAFALVARELKSLASPNEAVFYTSGRTSNEAAFLYQLFIRLYGTNNLPDCSNMCHESSGVALKESLGVGKGSVTLEDFDHSDCIVIIGQNPGTNHPRMLTTLQKAARRGAKIISINPLHETALKHFKHPQEFWTWFGRGTPIASLHLPVRINGDLAVLKGIMKYLLEQDEQAPGTIIKYDFIREHTIGYEDLARDLKNLSWDFITEQSGLTKANIVAAGEIIKNAKAMICCWAMGITQQTYAVPVIQDVVNLLMLGGHLGRAGAGVCPVRGHSNVQGDRTMGIYEKPPQAFLDALEKEFNFKPPQAHGYDTVDAIHAMRTGKAKVFFAMGGNFLSATPDTEFTAEALRNTRLTVHVSTKLNRSHVVSGEEALILPCLGRTEIDTQASGRQFITVENSMGVIQKSQGNLTPAGAELLSEPAIVAGLAQAVFSGTPKANTVKWKELADNYDLIRHHIARMVPGFVDFNTRVQNPAGFHLPHAVRDNLKFDTASKKGEFKTFSLPRIDIPNGALMLMTMRSHDQFNTTIYGLNDRYRGIKNGRRVIFMNSQDILKMGFKAGQWVDITSHFQTNDGSIKKRMAPKFMVVEYDIPTKCAAAYFPEANSLVPIESVALKSNTPTYKTIVVTLAPTATAEVVETA